MGFFKKLFKSKDPDSKAYRRDMALAVCGQHIKYVTEKRNDVEEVIGRNGGLNIKDFETAIDVVRSVRGAKCAVSVKASPTVGVFRASLRSNDDTDVSSVAAHFGGGGHIRAAGCSVNADSAREALLMIVAELEKII